MKSIPLTEEFIYMAPYTESAGPYIYIYIYIYIWLSAVEGLMPQILKAAFYQGLCKLELVR